MRSIIVFVSALILYQLLFWEQALGINLTFFGWVLCGFSYLQLKPEINRTRIFLIILCLLSGIGVFLHNSVFSIFMFFVVVISLHSSWYVKRSSVIESFANGFLNFLNPAQGLLPNYVSPKNVPKIKGALYLRVAAIPVIICIIYIILFAAGNSIFNQLGGDFLKKFRNIFSNWSFPYFMFMVLGFIVIRWMLRSQWSDPIRIPPENSLRRKYRKHTAAFGNLALRNEYFSAIILFSLLNLLFLIVNIIDIKWVWFQFDFPQNYSLKDFVHEGVGWLIVTLLVSIALILYFFRGNLNNYPSGKGLKRLAYLWIAQNIILAISVMLRTFYYVDFHGLASKRIGVILFISIVLFGLGSLIYKILTKKNNYYIVRVNSAFILGAFVTFSLIPWSSVIARYNLAHSNNNEIDVDYYLDLDPQVYPLLYDHLDVIASQIEGHNTNDVRWIYFETMEAFKEALDLKTANYLKYREKLGWQSWSMADAAAISKIRAIADKEDFHQRELLSH